VNPESGNLFGPELDKPREKCGIVGIYGQSADIAYRTYDAIGELQHRGEQAAGISIFGERLFTTKGPGKIKAVFDRANLDGMPAGHIGVGHVRYQTVETGLGNDMDSIQPIENQGVVVAHNGNFTHFDGQPFAPNGASDTAYLSGLIGESLNRQSNRDLPQAVIETLKRAEGAYSLIVADTHNLIAIRDKRGFRPLLFGRQTDGTYVAASESVALDALEVNKYESLGRGEMLIINEHGAKVVPFDTPERGAFCMMELVYFSRPDSMYGAESVYTKRVRTGAQLADEVPADVDVVIGVPGTGLDAAKGYAERLGLPFAEKGIHKTGYERSFLGKDDQTRRHIARKKFNVTRDIVEGQRLAVIDDSLIRGTVTSVIVEKLRRFGAKEVHFRVASPPYRNACHFGIDTGRESELIARSMTIAETAEFIGVDSLGYLSLDGLKQALKYDDEELCDACVSGNYPIPVKIGTLAVTH